MKVLGIGVDVIKNKRVKSLINNRRFISRTFSKNEIKFSKKILKKINYFSKRFAAKEALVKALGTGFRNNLCFRDISILNDKKGKPYFLFNKKIKDILKKKYKLNSFKAHLSLSDEKKHSVSYVVLQKFKWKK